MFSECLFSCLSFTRGPKKSHKIRENGWESSHHHAYHFHQLNIRPLVVVKIIEALSERLFHCNLLSRSVSESVTVSDLEIAITSPRQGWAGMTFGHLGTGTGMKIPFPIFGNENGNGNSIPKCWEREWDVVIRGSDREREWHPNIEWKFFMMLLLFQTYH